ncbi:MAG: type II secretion system F family protein [Candidatus Paceibacterota bacterium]|jgi:type IV pilus assembly protein PilC
MLFSYTAKKDGVIVEDTINAVDRFAVSRELHSRGLVPLTIKEKGNTVSFNPMVFLNNFLGRVNQVDLIIFTRNLSGMLKAGLPLSRALTVLEKQTEKPVFKKVFATLSAEVNGGGTLSSGLAKFPNIFSKLFVSMTRAGEESGNLSGVISEVGMNLEKSHALNRKVRGALIYPGVILSAMVVLGILMFAFVVPTLAGTFKELGVTLPTSTRVLIWVGNFFSNNLMLTFVILFTFIFLAIRLLHSKFMAKYFDFIFLRIPAIGNLIKELNTARTARTLSSLLFSGVSIVRAVEITEDIVQNVYYKKVLQEAAAATEKGAPFGKVFTANPKLYPIMMSEMIEVGEETGKLSDMLLQIAIFYEEEIENKTKNLSTIIEPILMLVIGAAVGFFAISMISPLYSILGNIK